MINVLSSSSLPLSRPASCPRSSQLHIAVSSEPKYVLGVIRLASEPWMLDIQNVCGQTAMHLAAATGQATIVRTLLLFGARVSGRRCASFEYRPS